MHALDVVRRRSSIILGIGLALVAIPKQAKGTLLAYEGFDYLANNNANLGGRSSATDFGWNGAWAGVAGSTSLLFQNAGSSLVPPDGYGAGTLGIRVNHRDTTSASEDRRSFAAASQINLGADTTYYMSFLVRMTGASSFLITGRDSGTNDRWQVGMDAAHNLEMGVSGLATTGLTYTNGSTMLVVTKFIAGSANVTGADQIFMQDYVTGTDTVPLSEPATYAASVTGNTGVILTRLRIAAPIMTASDLLELDEIRIGTTWQDVVSVPEPAMGIAMIGVSAGLMAGRRRRELV